MYKYNFELDVEFAVMARDRGHFMSTSGFKSATDIAVAVENVGTVWFEWAVSVVVPFYDIIYRMLLSPLMEGLSQTMIELVFGPNRMPLRLAQEIAGLVNVGNVTAQVYMNLLNYVKRSVMVGHSHMAVVSRALAMHKEMYGVTFEGSQYEFSPLHGFFGSPPKHMEGGIVNEASGKSLFAMDDTIAKWNFRMPDWQKWWKPSNPYETFCLLAAGCVYDDRYDHICNASVGHERYVEYFSSWNRERTD
jgi:hypothetical protein